MPDWDGTWQDDWNRVWVGCVKFWGKVAPFGGWGHPSKSKFLRRAKPTAGIEVVLELEVDGVGDTLWGLLPPCPHGKGADPTSKMAICPHDVVRCGQTVRWIEMILGRMAATVCL